MEYTMKPIIIIGAGHAGLTLAREIRALDKTTPIIIVSQDPIQAYYKPNLSKALSMNKSAEQLIVKQLDALKSDLDADLLEYTSVLKISSENKCILCHAKGPDNKTQEAFELPYENLILATGASPIELPIIGAAGNVVSVNTLQDYAQFREMIKDKKQILIIGAGFVGCEFASDLSSNGYQVDVIDRANWPLEQVIPEQLGAEIKHAISKNGVNWHFQSTIDEIVEGKQGTLKAYLSNGSFILPDVIISAIGLSPNIQLAKDSGLLTARGIVVDEYSQTSRCAIYALGDCVEYDGQPLPFIAPATLAAKALAKTLTGNKIKRVLPPQPVTIKIANCPTLLCPPKTKEGSWHVSGDGQDLEVAFFNNKKELCGFALSGQKVSLKGEYLSRCSTPKISQGV